MAEQDAEKQPAASQTEQGLVQTTTGGVIPPNPTEKEGPPLPSHTQAVLQHITKVKLEMQEKIYGLQFQMKTLSKQNHERAEQLAELDARIQAQEAQIVLLRQEGTEKYQLEERDDWRALVESLTADRKRLNKQIEAAVKRKNAAEIDCSLARSTLQDLEQTVSELQSQLRALEAGARSENGEQAEAEPSSDNELQQSTGLDTSPSRASSQLCSANEGAIEDIRNQLQKQLERVQARRAARREEAYKIASKRQQEIDHLQSENARLFAQLSSANNSASGALTDSVTGGTSNDSNSSGCRVQ